MPRRKRNRGVAADVMVELLETLRQVDVPTEVLRHEDVSRTLPRRFGISGVIETQIKLQRDRARRGDRLPPEEVSALIQLVMRRPDSREIFFRAGASLAKRQVSARCRLLPRRFRLRRIRKRIHRQLAKLFGRRMGGFISGPFTLEMSASPFVDLDKSGNACQFISGFCQQALRDGVSAAWTVTENRCETKGEPSCRWVGSEQHAAAPALAEEAPTRGTA